MVFSLFGVHWVMPYHVVDLLASWSYKCRRCKSLVIWSKIPHCIMWGTWWERNARTFEGCERSTHDIKLFFHRTMLEWKNASGVYTFNSLTDLLDSVLSLFYSFHCFSCSLVHCLRALVFVIVFFVNEVILLINKI